MADSIEVCSRLMGSNKTNRIIQWMKENNQDRYIYVIPNLSEITNSDDVQSRVLSIGFKTPNTDNHKTKSESLKDLLKQGDVNIACTQHLYKMIDKECLALIRKNNMIVVFDEEISLIDVYNYASPSDLVSLLNDGKVEVNPDDGLVKWIANEKVTEPYLDKDHKHHRFYTHIVNEFVYTTKSKVDDKGKRSASFMVSQLTKELINSAKRIIIITYLFNGSILESFLKLKGFKIEKFKDYEIKEIPLADVVKRIDLLPYDKKMLGYKLNSTWWKNATAEQIKDVGNFIRRSCMKTKVDSDLVMWTCPSNRVKANDKSPKKGKNYLQPQAYSRDSVGNTLWLGCNVRATNAFEHKKMVIHCYNRYPHVGVQAYLREYGVKVDEDRFAVAEMLQWIFRSNCRKIDGHITLAIASKRMYDLYVKWAKGGFYDEF